MMAHLARSEVQGRRKHVAEAEIKAARALALSRRGAGLCETSAALIALAVARQRVGDPGAAHHLVGEARRTLECCPDPGRLPALLESAESELHRAVTPQVTTARAGAARLTERELAVLRLLPSSRSQREVAATLYVSLNTVKTHIRGIYRKLGISTREEAVSRARALRLL